MLGAPKSNSTILLVVLFLFLSNATVICAFDGEGNRNNTPPRNVYIVGECFDDRPDDEKELIGLKAGVTKEIPRMLANQINARKIFDNAGLIPLDSKYVSHAKLDSLREAGVDAVIIGNIIYSHKYHKTNIGRVLLYAIPLGLLSTYIFNFTFESASGDMVVYWYGPGMALGAYLETLHKEYALELVVKMISTSTYKVIHSDEYEIQLERSADKKSFGMQTKSFQAALNDIVENLSRVSIAGP